MGFWFFLNPQSHFVGSLLAIISTSLSQSDSIGVATVGDINTHIDDYFTKVDSPMLRKLL
jgi:hypothetical protein